MLRRPLATVISSISIRSGLSTRLFCAPSISTDDQITTVQTTGIAWTKNGIDRTLNGAYWGEGDPRNTMRERSEDKSTFTEVKLFSIVMALKQAKKDGLTRICIQTDSTIDNFRDEKKDVTTSTGQERRINVMYNKIVDLMNEMEVTIEYRSHVNANGEGNNVVKLLVKDKLKQYLNSKGDSNSTGPIVNSNCSTTPNPTVGDQIPTVRTTGMGWKRYGIDRTMIGVYWGEGDPRNIMEGKRHDQTGDPATKLRAIAIALEQAKKDGVKRIRVQTDFKMFFSIHELCEKFEKRDLTTLNEWQLSTRVMSRRIRELMHEMEVIFEYRSNFEDRYSNEVIKLIAEEKSKQFPNVAPITAPFSKSDWIITPNGALPLEGRTVPTVYIAGRLDGKGGGSYASLWVPESIEHLEISQRPVDSMKRLDFAYVSRAAAEIVAIYLTIKEAQLLNISEIRVVTGSLRFLQCFKRDWIHLEGGLSAHHGLYLKMKARMESIQVHFEGAKFTEDNEDVFLAKVHEMAKESNDKYMTEPVSHRE